MAALLPGRGGISGIEPQCRQFGYPHSRLPLPDNIVQNGIVLFQSRNDSSLQQPARTGQMVMMPVLAVFTAELLVCPPIIYLISAFKTAWSAAVFPFCIFHIHIISSDKYAPCPDSIQYPDADFSFSYAIFFFFLTFRQQQKKSCHT